MEGGRGGGGRGGGGEGWRGGGVEGGREGVKFVKSCRYYERSFGKR